MYHIRNDFRIEHRDANNRSFPRQANLLSHFLLCVLEFATRCIGFR